jgi:hypothetical protein
MPGFDASELFVPGTGNVYTAPADTAMPSDAVTVPDPPWVDHGYTTEDGVKFTFGKTTDALKGWQSFDTLRLIVTEAPKSVGFTLMQANAENLLLELGGGTIDDVTGIYTPPDPSALDLRALFVRGIDGDDTFGFWAPRVLLSDNVEFSWKKTGAAEAPLVFAVQAASPYAFQMLVPAGWKTGALAARHASAESAAA